MYNGYPVSYNDVSYNNPDDERFFLAPFLLGGIAGTALGYGISNNNQGNYYPAYPAMPVYPVYTYPAYPNCPNCSENINSNNSNNYYYY